MQGFANATAEALSWFVLTPYVDPSDANAYSVCNSPSLAVYDDASLTEAITPSLRDGTNLYLQIFTNGSLAIETSFSYYTTFYFRAYTLGNKSATKQINIAVCGDETILSTGNV